MNTNIKFLLEACAALRVPYEICHPTENVIAVTDKETATRHVFVNWSTPLNPQSVVNLCKDKGYFYTFYKDVIQMPVTHAFLDPSLHEKYSNYIEQADVPGIVTAIDEAYDYPIIIKKNRGSCGSNVFKVDDAHDAARLIARVFDKNTKAYDYVVLAQEYIDIDIEYRVVFLDGVCQFAYVKNTDDAVMTDNISPLHWSGSRALLVNEPDELKVLQDFCTPVFEKMAIPYCGLDVARDKSGQHWLIEANSSPGFDFIARGDGGAAVLALYKNVLTRLGCV